VGLDTDVKELNTKRIFYYFTKNSGFACKQGYANQVYHDSSGDTLDYFFVSRDSINVGTLPFAASTSLPSPMKDGCTVDCFEPGTDYVMIKKNENFTHLASTNSSSDTLSLDSVNNISTNDYLMLCNSAAIDIVKVSGVVSSTNTVSLTLPPTGSTYEIGDYAGKMTLEILYTRDTGDEDANGDSIFSLYVYIMSGSSNGMSYELIRGVHDLHVEYGTVLNNVITWTAVSSDTGVNKNDHSALKLTFMVNDESFNKIILL
jgi:type IV pilus assembly protein PilW